MLLLVTVRSHPVGLDLSEHSKELLRRGRAMDSCVVVAGADDCNRNGVNPRSVMRCHARQHLRHASSVSCEFKKHLLSAALQMSEGLEWRRFSPSHSSHSQE